MKLIDIIGEWKGPVPGSVCRSNKKLGASDESSCKAQGYRARETDKKFKGKKKMIGICLGFQLILYNEGGKIRQQNKIYHGYQSKIKVNGKSKIFKKNKVFNIGRYHSLKLNEPYFSKNLNITMRCTKTNTAMAFEDNLNKIYGFQFHPDSFLTENGNFFIKKILSSK